MPNSEDLTMNTVETTGAQSARAALTMDPHLLELYEGDHTMLPRGDPRDNSVRNGLGAFCMHVHA
jgi:hypothetical protein